MNKEQLRDEWNKINNQMCWVSLEESDMVAAYWLNVLSLREQELWNKCEEMKVKAVTDDGLNIGDASAYNFALSDIQSLLKKWKNYQL